MKSEFYIIGQKDALNFNKDITSNPYEFGTQEHYEWFMGFDYISKKLLDMSEKRDIHINNDALIIEILKEI